MKGRRLPGESNLTGQKRQQENEPVTPPSSQRKALGGGEVGLSKNRLRWGMEGGGSLGVAAPCGLHPAPCQGSVLARRWASA